MNVKTSFFGAALLIFTTVILFTTQTSETEAQNCDLDPENCHRYLYPSPYSSPYNTPPYTNPDPYAGGTETPGGG